MPVKDAVSGLSKLQHSIPERKPSNMNIDIFFQRGQTRRITSIF